MSYISKFNELVCKEENNPKIYLAIFPSSKYFYIQEAIHNKLGIRVPFREIKKLIQEEFGDSNTGHNTKPFKA